MSQATPTPSEPSAGIARANGIDIAYESFGSPDHETVLLIAGTGRRLTDWPRVLVDRLVDREFRVIRFDNRDVGLSTTVDAAVVVAGAGLCAVLEMARVGVSQTARGTAAASPGRLGREPAETTGRGDTATR